jgi:Secretion system C-terminal sorting domain
VADTWILKADLIGGGKSDPAAFSLNGYGYVGMGYDNLFNQTNQLYQYEPDSVEIPTVVNEIKNSVTIRVVPNPVEDFAMIEIAAEYSAKKVVLQLFSPDGKLLRTDNSEPSSYQNQLHFSFQRGDLPSGLYHIMIEVDGKNIGSRKVVMK